VRAEYFLIPSKGVKTKYTHENKSDREVFLSCPGQQQNTREGGGQETTYHELESGERLKAVPKCQ